MTRLQTLSVLVWCLLQKRTCAHWASLCNKYVLQSDEVQSHALTSILKDLLSGVDRFFNPLVVWPELITFRC